MESNSLYATAIEITKTITTCCETEGDVRQLLEVVRQLIEVRIAIQSQS